jgi:hypothetical protein
MIDVTDDSAYCSPNPSSGDQHMKQNVGSMDRVLRVVLGLALLAYYFLGQGSMRWIGLIGLVPLITAALGTCPLYSILGISTCPTKRTT